MPLRRFLTVALWLATTASATGLAWAATSVVAGDVTDRPAPVVAQREVVEALRADPPAVTTPSTTQAPPPATPDPDPPAPSTAPAEPPSPLPAMPTTTVAPPVSTTTAPVAVTTTVPPVAGTPPTPTGAFSSAGGVVTVTCTGFFIRLVTASPADGYAVEVLDRGPATVDVHFSRSGEEVRIRLVCFGGGAIRIPDQHPQAALILGQR